MTASRLYAELLGADSRAQAAFELRQLFARRIGWDSRLPWIKDQELGACDRKWLESAAASIAWGYPLQYILGEWEFYGLTFKVGPGVLIPRPDTEIVVTKAMETLKAIKKPRIADLCAGSGAIGIALAVKHNELDCRSVELSKEAYSYLVENIELNGVKDRVMPMNADAMGPLDLPPLDMIVSNPPYLTRAELARLPLADEPAMAFDGGEDGLDFYRKLISRAGTMLRPGGRLLFEVGYTQAADVARLMEDTGYSFLETVDDYSGIPRCVSGVWPG